MSLQRFPSGLRFSVQKLVQLNLKCGRQQPIMAGSFSRLHDNKKHADTATSNMTTSHPFSTVSQSSQDPEEAQSPSVDHDLSKQDSTSLLRSVLQRGAKTQDPKSPGRTWRSRGGGGGGDGGGTWRTAAATFAAEEDENPSVRKAQLDPKTRWPIHPELRPHIRACLSDIEFETQELGDRDTGLSVCTLGTGAGLGSRMRSNSATVVKHKGDSYLVDAGEGVSKQFHNSRIGTSSLRKLFITHMHGDHVFGLPGLLLNLQLSGIQARDRRSLEIFGPVGLYNYIATTLSLCGTELRKIDVIVYELHGGTQRSMRHAGNCNHFRDFRHRGLIRKMIKQSDDGTWDLAQPVELDTPDLALAHWEPSGMSIKAAEIHHTPQLQCFGYTFQEPKTQPRPIRDAEYLRSLGIEPRTGFRLLKAGFPVFNGDKTKKIHPDDVCGEAAKPRKVTILGDCCMVPSAMETLAQDSDVVVHEATLSQNEKGAKAVMGGHATAAQAGAFANKVKATVLLMNHVSLKVDGFSVSDDTARNQAAIEHMAEAESRVRGSTPKVQLCYDHMELLLPRKLNWGFKEP